MSSTYGHILRIPGAAAFSIAGLLARFPMSMQGISTILAVQALYGSYSAAGAVAAANIVAAALGAPALARLVDERGQSKVMLPALAASGTALFGLILATSAHADLWLLMALAALAGGLSGSMGSLVRSRWTTVVTRPEDVHTAFSLEAAFDEVALIIGPVLTTALCTSSMLPVTSGWIASLSLQLIGGLWLVAIHVLEDYLLLISIDVPRWGTVPWPTVLLLGGLLIGLVLAGLGTFLSGLQARRHRRRIIERLRRATDEVIDVELVEPLRTETQGWAELTRVLERITSR